jgi:hypothetical protein
MSGEKFIHRSRQAKVEALTEQQKTAAEAALFVVTETFLKHFLGKKLFR